MTPIHGIDVKVYLNETLLFCGTNMTFSEKRNTQEATGSEGRWTYNRSNRRSWQVEVEGLSKVDSSDGQGSIFDILGFDEVVDFWDLLVTFMDIDGNQASIGGKVVIPKEEWEGPVDEFGKASITLQGTGSYAVNGVGGSSTSCVPIAAGDSFSPPDAVTFEAYSYSFPLTGTGPYTLESFSLSGSWMSANIVANHLVLSGTPGYPGDTDTGVLVDVVISNPCGSIELSDTIDVIENGRNVFVINNSDFTVTVSNENGHSYAFPPSNAGDGNIKFPGSAVTIVVSGGSVDWEFLQDLVAGGTLVNGGGPTSGGTITSDDPSITNYIRFSND